MLAPVRVGLEQNVGWTAESTRGMVDALFAGATAWGGPAAGGCSALPDGCADAAHDASEVGEVAAVERVCERALQEIVMALAGSRGY